MNKRTKVGEALTGLILDVFRLNGSLLVAGDRLVADLGLTSARWQILGAITQAERPESVAWLARSMGLHRQGVQRIVNELERDGIVEFKPNPHHKRAHLVLLTAKGRKLYADAMKLQAPWVNALADGLKLKDLETTRRVIEQIRERLEK